MKRGYCFVLPELDENATRNMYKDKGKECSFPEHEDLRDNQRGKLRRKICCKYFVPHWKLSGEESAAV